ncbi:mitochondrial carrier protein mtm1 [Phtheirospermum japonicum]|uniref:Mitochondrial carrier protein mtm1 n=1 Tax=Phtheirospermum japonicum TaxID=374723 RepID=A0A830C1A2_9LAMI|nr:mitochondrial carrier protein mtm1 [Phtheirospermum japonicum]
MVGSSRQGLPSWMGVATATRKVELDKNMVKDESLSKDSSNPKISDVDLSFRERAFSAGGAAFISALIVNPLDVAKTRLQAQAAGVLYDGSCHVGCFETSPMLPELKYVSSAVGTQPSCSADCTRYRGTLDVFYKIIKQVGIYMPLYDLFRNYLEDATSHNAPSITPYVPLVAGSLARSIACVSCYPIDLARTRMQAFKHSQSGVKPPGVLKTLIGVVSNIKGANNHQSFQSYRILWTGLGAQLARDVPFSAVCWSTLEPKDPTRALTMTTRQTLVEIWRDGGVRGLFTGASPRVARAGPSVGIVVSCYEAVKYVLQYRHSKQ